MSGTIRIEQTMLGLIGIDMVFGELELAGVGTVADLMEVKAMPSWAQSAGADDDPDDRGVLAAADRQLADILALRPDDRSLEGLDASLLGQRRAGKAYREKGGDGGSHGAPSGDRE